MSGVLEQVLAAVQANGDTLKRIEAALSGGEAPVTQPSPPATDKPVTRGRGRPVGSTKAATEAPPVVETKAAAKDESSFLDDEPEVEVKYTKDQVRAALTAYNKKVGDEAKTRALLKTASGVDTLSALPEDKFAAVIKAATAA